MNSYTMAGDPPQNIFHVSSNNSNFDNNSNNWRILKPGESWFGSADSAGNIQPWQPVPNEYTIPTPWIISDQTFPIDILKIGDLRINSSSGMIERWDGTKWEEYGKPITPLPESPKTEDEGFELGGAL